MNTETKREIMINHYKNPLNKDKEKNSNYISVNANNESCIDNINVHILYEDNIIKDISFDAEACAISISSTSIMIKNLIGKTKDEAKLYIENFEKMINNEKYDKNILNEAVVYDEIYKQNNRKICALLPYTAIKKSIYKENK